MMMQLKLAVIVFFLSSLSVIAQAEQIRVGVESINFHPHYWQGSSGEYSGFAADYFKLFSEAYGYDIEFVALPPAQLLTALINSQVDLKYPDNPVWGGDSKNGLSIQYTNPLVKIVEGTLVNPRRKGRGLENLKTIGTVKGFTPWIYGDLINSGEVEVMEFDNLKDLTRAGIKNEIDGVFFNVVVATYFIDNLSTLPFILEFDNTLPFTASEFFASSITRKDVVEDLNRFSESHMDEISQLKVQYEIERNLDNDLIGVPAWKIENSN